MSIHQEAQPFPRKIRHSFSGRSVCHSGLCTWYESSWNTRETRKYLLWKSGGPESSRGHQNNFPIGSSMSGGINNISARHAVGLYWVLEHVAVRGNETADGLARNGSATGFVGPELALGVSRQDLRNKISRWLGNQQRRRWQNLGNSRQARELISGPSRGTKVRFLSFNRLKSRVVTRLLTGHNTLCRHHHLMGLMDSPLCRKCGAEDETSAHILCLWPQSGMRISAPFQSQRTLTVKTWGPSGTLAKRLGSLEGCLGHKGPVYKRPRCIGAERTQTRVPIYLSIYLSVCLSIYLSI
jgi:hypothetical protein